MKAKEYTSIAVARWIAEHLSVDNDFACEGLPPMDVSVLLNELAEKAEFKAIASQFSVAIVGQDLTPVDMQEIARGANLEEIRAFTDDLHLAAEWRNDRERHPRAIVLASGYNAGVHTLSHYARPSSANLARTLLLDATENLKSREPDSPEVHLELLRTLVEDIDLESLLSLESCARFLEQWDDLRSDKKNHAPWHALPALGLLTDENLFGTNDLGKRLKFNLDTTLVVRTLRSSMLHTVAGKRYRDKEKERQVSEAVAAVERYLNALQRGVHEPLDLKQALVVVKPPKDVEISDVSEDENLPEGNGNQIDESGSLGQESSEALLDGREDDLKSIADAIDEGWEERDQRGEDKVEISVTLPGNGQLIQETVYVAPDVLEWVGDFCNESTWGGYFESSETSLRIALAGVADQTPTFIHPQSIVVIEGETISLDSILSAWDQDLHRVLGTKTALVQTWREFSALRSELLPHIGKLIYHPRQWLDGHPQTLERVRRYLELAATLYRETQEHYQVMTSVSPDWARAALEALLALDIIQVRIPQDEGKFLAKAILLPTHPLHLWRNERLSTLLRGLSQSTIMGNDERTTVATELERPEQFLSLVRLSSLPEGRGLDQTLPFTSQIEGLPVFENLSNACSGADGVRTFRLALEQFILLYPNHCFPLRVAIVNPPPGAGMVMEVVSLLNDRRFRGGQRLSAVHLDLYASGQHRDRVYGALRLQDSRKEDEIQEKVALGRLHIRLHEDELTGSTSLESVVQRLRERPSHLVAIFDESTIRLRQQALGNILPMSPFCVRYDVRLDQRSGKIDLLPQPGDSPFSEFLQLMNELDGSQRDGTLRVHADAEELAHTADTLLQGDEPATRWLFLADRTLPSEAGMQSVRIWERREGLRDTFLASRDLGNLARLLRPIFSRCNITLSPDSMNRLLRQGARLLGSGLLEIIKKQDGLPDQKKVIGLAGLLFAARDLQHRFPGALVISVDHPLARLWLRSGVRSLANRCDLIMLWRKSPNSIFDLVAVEVKSSDEERLSNATSRLAHAVKQIGNTLDAISDGLEAVGPDHASPLSVPRCEMLKQTLARAAQARSGEPAVDRANRIRWGKWLVDLFEQEQVSNRGVRLSGCVMSVLLRRAAVGLEERVVCEESQSIIHRILGEQEIGQLLEWEPGVVPSSDIQLVSDNKHPESESQEPKEVLPPTLTQMNPTQRSTGMVEENIDTKTPLAVPNQKLPAQPVVREPDMEKWPPPVNQLGLIGQNEAIDRLVEQANFFKRTNQRFPDKLLVGPAGVGKSTLARKIGVMLLDRKPLLFNGSDLSNPEDIVKRLKQENLLNESTQTGLIAIESCLIFIDEVHGISKRVATALLSAMDDGRETSIGGRLYDFNRVIFLLATTDPGSLTEAFQSRPSKTYLQPYSLHEMAGIVWFHGKLCLDKAELSKDACYEIAARNRCNPRRSVRELGETLLPHFFTRMVREGNPDPSLKEVAEIMTRENLEKFYESQGVDFNGLNSLARKFMDHLKRQGSCSEPTLRQALGLAHPQDFVETAEYLSRLGLIETSTAGRRLTRQGTQYLKAESPPDLRDRISRAM